MQRSQGAIPKRPRRDQQQQQHHHRSSTEYSQTVEELSRRLLKLLLDPDNMEDVHNLQQLKDELKHQMASELKL